jgi:hypothetical protein
VGGSSEQGGWTGSIAIARRWVDGDMGGGDEE